MGQGAGIDQRPGSGGGWGSCVERRVSRRDNSLAERGYGSETDLSEVQVEQPGRDGRRTGFRRACFFPRHRIRRLGAVRQPWNALTRIFTQAEVSEGDVREAWSETAARLGLVRLGWISHVEAVGGVLAHPSVLAFPTEKAIARWRALASVGAHDRTEEIRSIEEPGGTLVAGAPKGGLPAGRVLRELATLAVALERSESVRQAWRSAERRAVQARRTVAASHDLRNELTRALLLLERGEERDLSGARRALRGARDLAQGALAVASDGDVAVSRLESAHLRTLLSEECVAATASARVVSSGMPRLRVKCPAGLRALVEPATFRRALRNLVTNALEATAKRVSTDEGADVAVVEVAAEHHAPEERFALAGFGARVTVRDEGVGMERRELEQYLAPREGCALLRSSGSTGVGTASLQLALEASGVPIRVRSSVGVGTSVELLVRCVKSRREGVPPILVDDDLRRARRTADRDGVWAVDRAVAAELLASSAS